MHSITLKMNQIKQKGLPKGKSETKDLYIEQSRNPTIESPLQVYADQLNKNVHFQKSNFSGTTKTS